MVKIIKIILKYPTNLKQDGYFKRMFGSVVVVIFQNVFHLEKHVNNVFLFFKNYF